MLWRHSLAPLSALLLSSCIHFPYEITEQPGETAHSLNTKTRPAVNFRPVWLIAGDLHSDLVVETDWLLQHGCRLPQSLHHYQHLCFGWGDRTAYTERWGSSDIPGALFWPSESIVQVVGFNTQVAPTFPTHTVTKALVPAENGHRLTAFLHASFHYPDAESTTPVTLRPAKWGYGYFISSPYSYYLPRMCNQWVCTALKEAGIHTATLSPLNTSKGLTKSLNHYNSL